MEVEITRRKAAKWHQHHKVLYVCFRFMREELHKLLLKRKTQKFSSFTTFNDGIQSVLDLNHSNDSLNEIDIAKLRKKLFDSGLMEMTVQFLPHD